MLTIFFGLSDQKKKKKPKLRLQNKRIDNSLKFSGDNQDILLKPRKHSLADILGFPEPKNIYYDSIQVCLVLYYYRLLSRIMKTYIAL